MNQIDKYFKQFVREQEVLGLARSTVRGYEHSFRCFRKLMPDLEIADITEEKVIDFYEKLRSRTRQIGKDKTIQGVRNSTIAAYRNKLGSFFNWLIKKKIVQTNPFKESKAPKIIQEGRKYLTQKEIKKILWAIGFGINWKDEMILKRNMAIILMALFCGLRKGELLGLKVDDVDFDNRIVNVRGNTSKSKRDRNIFINQYLYKRLTEYMDEREKKEYSTPYLFVSDNKDARFTKHGLGHTLKRITESTKFSFHMHQFRHTFAANIHYSGHDIFVIQNLLGHADIRMTSQYLRRFPTERARECVDKLGIDGLI